MIRAAARPPGPPAISLPFPPVAGASAPWLGPSLARWLAQIGVAFDRRMTDRYIAARIDRLAVTVYPTALPDRLELIAQLIVWMFVYDDQFDVGILRRASWLPVPA